jgi:hypothetical protein
MPKSEIKLNVFVASPSDVHEERELLSSICAELNKVWGDWLGLNLNLKKWETDIYPSVSGYSQNVINEQINDEYDIFIALFWNRLGTPTKKANSGTMEELNRAFAKFEKNNDCVDIMIYFKEQVGKHDVDQQKLVQEVKENMASRGTLYWEYKETKDFEPLLRIHLSLVAQKWSKKYIYTAMNINKNTNQEMNLLLDEYYIFLSGKTGILGVLHENISHALKLHLDKLKELGENIKNNNSNNKHLRLIDIFADINNSLINIIDSQLDLLVDIRRDFFQLLSKTISIEVGLEFSPRLEQIVSIISPWIQSSNDSIKEINILKNNLKIITDVTKEFGLSKKNMLSSFERYTSELEEVITLAKFALESIDSVIKIDSKTSLE